MFLWDRYMYPLIPLWMPWLGAGYALLSEVVSRWIARPGVTAPVLGMAAIVLVSASEYGRAREHIDFAQAADAPLREVGTYLRSRASPDQKLLVMGFGAVIPYYADADLGYLPFTEDEQRALRYVHWREPDYLVIRESELNQGPYLSSWLTSGVPDACARPLRRQQSARGQIHIWKWDCRQGH
jgi:hypothetical protein